MDISNEQLIRIITEEILRMTGGDAESVSDAVRAVIRGENASDRKSTPEGSEELRELQEATSARVGIGRSGPRMKTSELLKFRADHAAARDAVQNEVSEELLSRMGLFTVTSLCKDENEYLTRPDHGRVLSEDSIRILKERCVHAPQIQIFAAGGLSSVAIEANIETILPILTDSLGSKGYRLGTPFYVRYGRVGIEDAVSAALDAEVVCVLIGERPGLMTAESMSAYIAYRATPNMPESRRTVVSNIHRGGTAAAEAGAYVADVIEQIYSAKASGVELKR